MIAPLPTTSQAEQEVLRVLWEAGPGTVRQLRQWLYERGQHWAYSTVITLLGRLEKKGYAKSDKSGFAHVFQAAVSREEVMRRRLAEMANELCAGDKAPLVLALVEGERFTEAEIEEFRRLIDRLAPQPPARRKPPRR